MNIFALTLSLAIALFVVAPVSLSTAAGPPSAAERSDASSFELSGRIESVDYASNVIVVRSHGKSLSIIVTPTTAVEHQNQVGGMSDLRSGTRVHVTGVIRNGVMTAVSIVVSSKARSY